MDTIKVICTKCGKELEIPEELTEFSCLYCGERITRKKADPADIAADLDYVRAHLIEAVSRYPDYYKKLDRKKFFPAFETYEFENHETVEHMDRCFAADAKLVESVVSEFLDDLQAHWEKDSRWKHKTQRSAMYFETKLVLAIFLTPLVRKLDIHCAEDFRQTLHARWKERLPKEDWMPGDYEEIAAGFRRRKWCFITTATCLHEGKADDCAELTAFRAFRDGWLTEQGDTALIEEYYRCAPGIVAAIDYCDNAERRYAEIRTRWLEPCYCALKENRPEDCRERYVDMVRTLRERYAMS